MRLDLNLLELCKSILGMRLTMDDIENKVDLFGWRTMVEMVVGRIGVTY